MTRKTRLFAQWMSMLLLAVLLAPQLQAQSQPITVIVVRHAEKEAEPKNDPPLSAAGLQRASSLVDVLRYAGITAVYSTPYKRTMETARGVAEHFNLDIVETPIPNRSVAAYADSVAARARRDGGVILVVSHSNTIAPVIKALGGPELEEIPETDYGNVFVLTLSDAGVKMVRARF